MCCQTMYFGLGSTPFRVEYAPPGVGQGGGGGGEGRSVQSHDMFGTNVFCLLALFSNYD